MHDGATPPRNARWNRCKPLPLVQHNEEGAFGLVLNRCSDIGLEEVWMQVAGEAIQSKAMLHFGGPVDGPMMVLHNDPTQSDSEVIDGVFLTTQKEKIDRLVRDHATPAKYLTGYSGWAAGQLESEMDSGGWLVADASFDYVFGHHEDLWKTVTNDIGNRILLSSVSGRLVPPDPSLN